MDKRLLSNLFRERLQILLDRSGESQAVFARQIGIDRSALSQLLAEGAARLPRVETLLNIAEGHAVSLDWLLGLSHDQGLMGELHQSFEIEDRNDGADNANLLMRWHAEAAGSKIRYVPMSIPDLLRTPETIAYEAIARHQSVAGQTNDTYFRLDYNRQPGTDMEVCMPTQAVQAVARGEGIWSGLDKEVRAQQLDYMAALIRELYPSFRIFLFDERERFSVPYTVFGSLRAALFVGGMYLVLNNADAIRKMQQHFERLIRAARIHPHEAADYIGGLAVSG
ncbi:helix-turn-helix domain-containing protein [Rhizobium halophytocola]|uniref:Transcriptional regulator with XRE-family HTH domain n=1 Tax=Rhizobium halophytocola TaxID=735519 RepID=A0ABS4E4U7_9HYPH|nr:transcriptional regulator with XRE-family HTH domain [Rhizobium halophytocola]